MKTLLLSVAALFIAATTNAQNCVADFDISNTGTSYTFNFTGNQPANASISWYVGNQYFTGNSVTTTLTGPSMDIVSCQVTLIDSINNQYCSDSKMDTLFIAGSTNSYCSADFDLIQDPNSANTWYLLDQSTTTGALQYLSWDFGDGYSTNNPTPSHNYANVGTYVISLYIYTDSCWSIATDTLVVTSKATGTWVYGIESMDELSVENNDEFASAQLFPNPSDDGKFAVSLSSTESKTVNTQIVSLSGQVVYTGSKQINSGLNTLEYNTQSLESGVYMIILKDESNNMKTLRLVVR